VICVHVQSWQQLRTGVIGAVIIVLAMIVIIVYRDTIEPNLAALILTCACGRAAMATQLSHSHPPPSPLHRRAVDDGRDGAADATGVRHRQQHVGRRAHSRVSLGACARLRRVCVCFAAGRDVSCVAT
jgi:hypothetical protein